MIDLFNRVSGHPGAAQMEAEWIQESWRGSPAELVGLLSEVAKIVAKASGEDEPQVTLSLGSQGDDLRFDNLPEFSEFIQNGHPRLREARRLRAVCGRYNSVSLTFTHSVRRRLHAVALGS